MSVRLDVHLVSVPPGSAHDLMRQWNFSLSYNISKYKGFIPCTGDKYIAVWRPDKCVPVGKIITAIKSLTGEFEDEEYIASPSTVSELVSFKNLFPGTETGKLYALGEKIDAPKGEKAFVFAEPRNDVMEVGDCGIRFHTQHSDAFLTTFYRKSDIPIIE